MFPWSAAVEEMLFPCREIRVESWPAMDASKKRLEKGKETRVAARRFDSYFIHFHRSSSQLAANSHRVLQVLSTNN